MRNYRRYVRFLNFPCIEQLAFIMPSFDQVGVIRAVMNRGGRRPVCQLATSPKPVALQ